MYIYTEINTNIYIQILCIYICTHCPYVYSQYLYGCESVCVVSVKERGGKVQQSMAVVLPFSERSEKVVKLPL